MADAPGTYQWTFKEPVADLWDESGDLVGRHYAGPTWESHDGSTVVGAVLARADAPEQGAIPWLLLRARSTDGAGDFSRVTYVQRLETVGGVAPSDGCDQETANDQRAVEYRATYTFYGFDPRHIGDAE